MSHRHRRAQFVAPTPAPVAGTPFVAAPRPQPRVEPDYLNSEAHRFVQDMRLSRIAEAQSWALSESIYRSVHRDDLPPPPPPAPIVFSPFDPPRW